MEFNKSNREALITNLRVRKYNIKVTNKSGNIKKFKTISDAMLFVKYIDKSYKLVSKFNNN